jgi:hypothetical protein
MNTAPVVLELASPLHVVRVGPDRVYRSPDLERARQAARVEAKERGTGHVWVVGHRRGRPDEEAQRFLVRIAGGPQ